MSRGNLVLESIGSHAGSAKARLDVALPFLRDLLERVGAEGVFKCRVAKSETGKAVRQGIVGMTVRTGQQPHELLIRVQPGSNDTCSTICLFVPHGTDTTSLRDQLLDLRGRTINPPPKVVEGDPAKKPVVSETPQKAQSGGDVKVCVATAQPAREAGAPTTNTPKQVAAAVVPVPKGLSAEAAVILCAMYVRKDGKDFPARGNNFWSNVPVERRKAIRHEARDVGLMIWDSAEGLDVVFRWGIRPTLFQAALAIYQLVDGESLLRADVVGAIEQDYPADIIFDAFRILTNPMHYLLEEDVTTGTLSHCSTKRPVVYKSAVTQPKRAGVQAKAVSVSSAPVVSVTAGAPPSAVSAASEEISRLQEEIHRVEGERAQLRELIQTLTTKDELLGLQQTDLRSQLAAKEREHEEFIRTTEQLRALLANLSPEMQALALQYVGSSGQK